MTDERPDLAEANRPDAVRGMELTAQQQYPGQHLRDVHDMYRGELEVLTALADLVRSGEGSLDDLRGVIHGMSVRTNIEQFGAICLRYCSMLTQHHTLEDRAMFPAVRETDGGHYAGVVDQLEHEHGVIHEQLRRLDEAVLAMDRERSAANVDAVLGEVDALAAMLLSHFRYEETQMAEPLGLVGLG